MLPLSLFDFGEFVVVEIIFRVHLNNLRFCGCAHYLYYLDQMVNAAFSDEERNPVQHLQHHTAQRPDVNHRSVVSCAKDQLWGTITP